MNVTNATVFFRSDSAASFTSANTTLGNATYNAPELAFEQDTKRVKVGIGNWTTIGYLANATQLAATDANVTNLTATVANKTDVGHTHVIANTTGLVDGQFFAADNLTNSSYWASAGATAAREKRTNTNITVTGGDAPPWNVRVRRRWSFGLHLGTGQSLAIAGRTNRIEPATWQGMGTSSYTLASGNLRVGLRSWSGGWVNTIANQILDWMMGGSFPSGITNTLYFALSTTPVSSSVTEPTTGSYARVSKVRNATTDFEETGDCGYIWTNKTAITFPSPTGDWGLIQGVAIYDASTSGNLIAAVPLNRPIRVYNGDQAPVFRPGALQISL